MLEQHVIGHIPGKGLHLFCGGNGKANSLGATVIDSAESFRTYRVLVIDRKLYVIENGLVIGKQILFESIVVKVI